MERPCECGFEPPGSIIYRVIIIVIIIIVIIIIIQIGRLLWIHWREVGMRDR